MRLRWKKMPRETGINAGGAWPRGSFLWDGKTEYATVYASGGDWRGPLRGWYWVIPSGSPGGWVNTCQDLSKTEKEAKDAAMAHVKKALAHREKEAKS